MRKSRDPVANPTTSPAAPPAEIASATVSSFSRSTAGADSLTTPTLPAAVLATHSETADNRLLTMGRRPRARSLVVAGCASTLLLVAAGGAPAKLQRELRVPGCDANHQTRGSWTGAAAAKAAFYCYGAADSTQGIPLELVNKSDAVVLSVSLPPSAAVLMDDGFAAKNIPREAAEAATPSATVGCVLPHLGACSLMPHHVLYFRQPAGHAFELSVNTQASEDYFVAFHVAHAMKNEWETQTLQGKIATCARAVEAAYPHRPRAIASLTGILETIRGCHSLYRNLRGEHGTAASADTERAIDAALHADAGWAQIVEQLQRHVGRSHIRP
jgi:hypothetical protein